MAVYIPDYEFSAAKDVVEKLGNTKEELLIKYYIETKEKEYKELLKETKKYRKFFEQFNSFLPKDNRIY